MRSFNRIKARGFTLVELMIVVAIIGVLAALAIYGVKKYLATAKSAEARNSLGAMNRGAVAAYERESAVNEVLGPGAAGGQASHALCASSTKVPATITNVTNKKYVANAADNNDYHTGDSITGWKCLKFEMTEPQYYQYQYERGTATLTPGIAYKGGAGVAGWAAEAIGDLDGNGTTSQFQMAGAIDAATKQPISATTIADLNPEE